MKKSIVLIFCCSFLVNSLYPMHARSVVKHLTRLKSPKSPFTLKGARRGIADIFKFFIIVQHEQKAIIQRWGEFDRTVGPGLWFKLPFRDDIRHTDWGTNRIDMRERYEEMPKQLVITKDNVAMGITGLVYYQIQNAEDSVYKIENLPKALNKLAQTTLRNLVGGLHLDETLVSRNRINERLCAEVGEAAKKWSVKITRVELQQVDPPDDIRLAMEREMTAERNRRALILQAEGERRAAILQSEAVKESAILEAEGKATARTKLAQAEAESIAMIQAAIQKHGSESSRYLMGMKYIETLPKVTEGKAGKTVVVPYDAQSLTNITSIARALWSDAESKIDKS